MQKNTAFANGNFYAHLKCFSNYNLLFIMRLSLCCSVFLLLGLTVVAAVNTFGQSIEKTEVSLHVQSEPLKAALRRLEKESGFNIFFPSAIVNAYQRVTIQTKNRSVAATLDLLLTGTPLEYHQEGNKVLLSVKKSNSTVVNSIAEVKRITGIVRDENGEPLAGVSVNSKTSRMQSTATDANGHFNIDVESDDDQLVFSFIGYKSQTVSVKGTATLDIHLQQVAGSLDEVQVIGYGRTTKRDNTGAVSSITAKDIGNQPVSNPLAALQGRLPGVQVTQNNGLPGSGFRVQIRGIGSLGSGTLPLYIVDGVPFTLFNGGSPPSDGLNFFGIGGAIGGEMSPLSTINPSDIERIDVLKDADATAIYGSKGANGVILITTKKGKSGKTRFGVNVYHGISKVPKFLDMLSTQDYLAMRRAAFAASGTTPNINTAPDLLLWDQNANTDWQERFIGGTARTTNADISVTGGNAQNTFLFSSNYRREGTVYPGSYGANTFSNRLNAGHKSEDNRFNLNLSVNYTHIQNNSLGTDLTTLYNLPPNLPTNNADGSLYWNTSVTNPLSYLLSPNNNTATNLIGNLNMSYALLPGLNIKANAGYTLTGLKQTQETPLTALNPINVNPAAPNNQLLYANNTNSNYILEPQLEYAKKIGDGNLQALVGTTFQRTIADGLTLLGTGFSSDALIGNLNNAASIINYGSNNSDYRYNAVFGRLNYNWKEKYYLDGTFRRDGSSRFGSNYRFGNFWAVGAAWIFTQESFAKNNSWLSFGKLRGSYGLTGNDQIQNYLYDSYYQAIGSTSTYQGQSVIYPSNIANPNLHWETNRKLDVAVELGFLQDRIYLKADYFRNRSSDQLINLALPTQSGFNSYRANFPAVVQNKGFEFELTSTNFQSKTLKWTTSLNFTFLNNKILSIDNPSLLFNSSSYVVGQPVNGILLYQFTGLNPQTGVPIYQDLNGDNQITSVADRLPAPIGNPYYGGITNGFTYKNFQLDFTFMFNHRMGYLNNSSSYPLGIGLTNQNTSALERWTSPGSNAVIPGATTVSSTPYSNYNSSTANWGNASFIKLKNVSLNYMFSPALNRAIGFKNVNLFARGENLVFWAKQKYTLDPEGTRSGTGTALGTGQFIAMPQLRTIVLGLNCTF